MHEHPPAGQQLGRLDVRDRLVPDLGGDVVLKRGDPLRSMLDGQPRLDYSLVILPGSAAKGEALSLLDDLLRLLGRAIGSALALTIVYWVDAALQLLACLVGQLARLRGCRRPGRGCRAWRRPNPSRAGGRWMRCIAAPSRRTRCALGTAVDHHQRGLSLPLIEPRGSTANAALLQ
jgi:hypothetical protein